MGGIVEGMRVRSLLPLALVALSFGALPSRADLEVRLQNGDRVVGTIDPPGEVEVYRFELPRGAALKVTAKGRKTRPRPDAPHVRLRLLGRFDQEISGPFLKNKTRSARIRGFVAPESGPYALEVRGDGFRKGDYSLSLVWKTARKHKFKDLDTSEGIQELDFAADAGARIDVKAKARRGSASRPVVFQLLRVEGDATSIVKTFTFPVDGGRTHEVTAEILRTGDHRLIVRDAGGVGGPTDVVLKMKTKKAHRAVIVTDDQLDPPPGGVDILATILVDAAGGATPAGVPALTVPRDALPRLRAVQLGAGDPFAGPGGQGLLPAGPGIYVGPESVEFARLVELSVPYDDEKFPEGMSELRIVRLESTGLHAVLDASSVVVDADAGSASIAIGRGGMYAAFRLVPPPRPTSVTPFAAHQFGGYPVTLGGTAFRDARDAFG